MEIERRGGIEAELIARRLGRIGNLLLPVMPVFVAEVKSDAALVKIREEIAEDFCVGQEIFLQVGRDAGVARALERRDVIERARLPWPTPLTKVRAIPEVGALMPRKGLKFPASVSASSGVNRKSP